jgi:formimidoylglutamate deiminase
MRLFAPSALLPTGWAPDVAIDVAPDGTILTVEAGAIAGFDDVHLGGPVIPGLANLHSHAFQRAMAGSAERRARGNDDFWGWRDAMYALAETLDPDRLYAIARDVYREMLVAGYTGVAEFHYLHRDPSGAWYDDRAAMARALIEAAKDAGIAICLLPALYAHGDAGGAPLGPHQRRFATSVDEIVELGITLRADYADDDVVIGICAHSLRAVTPAELRELIDSSPHNVPVHLHVSEQLREVEAVQRALGARPVAWLLAEHNVNDRWCLVHATHLDDAERDALARSGAIVGLCPTTEANLGDGVFPLADYLRAGGRIGIGSDSNVSISPVEELRWLEYGQRLVSQRRLIAAIEDGASCGETLYRDAALGGAHACGLHAGVIAPGARADLVVLDAQRQPLAEAAPHEMLDRYLFATDRAAPLDVFVRGRSRLR